MKLFKAIATIGGLTGLSRIAGFARDILTASIMGAGPITDAFFVALKLPNLFRRITAEGAFMVSFVPLYTEAMEKDGEEKAAVFAGNVFAVMLALLSAFTLLAIALMPFVITIIAPGFGEDMVRHELATEFSRVTFPYLLLMSLTALAGAMLNAHDRFAPFAAAPILFNLSLIAALLCAGLFETAGHAMAYGVLLAGILQCGFLFICLKKARLMIRWQKPQFTPRLKRLFKLMGPGVLGAGAVQINLFFDMMIASLLDTGSISHLYYADRLYQLPLGIVGIAIGTALLPMLSKAVAAGDKVEVSNLFNRSMEVSLLLALPAATGLLMAATPIIMTLFEHGAFDASDTLVSASVLPAYALGLPAYMIIKVYNAAFWSNQDTATPVKIAAIATVINILLSLFFIFVLDTGAKGIALATSISAWLNLVMIYVAVKKIADVDFDPRFKRAAIKIIAMCAVMGAFLWGAMRYLEPLYFTPDDHIAAHVFGLAVLVGGGALLYAAGIVISGVISVSELKRYLTR